MGMLGDSNSCGWGVSYKTQVARLPMHLTLVHQRKQTPLLVPRFPTLGRVAHTYWLYFHTTH